MKTKTNMPTLSSQREESDSQQLQLRSQDWDAMEDAFIDAEAFQKLEFGDFEMRFVPMAEQSYSLLLSKNGLAVFHFMWNEVDGLTSIAHRLVTENYRGQGIGSKVMEMIVKRLQKKADAGQRATHLMMETTQLSVVGLALRIGMQFTQGQGVYDEFMSKSGVFRMDPATTTIVNDRNIAQLFRLSRVLSPQPKMLKPLQWAIRSDVSRLLAA